MAYNFNEIIDRKHTESFKWNCFEEDVLPMWVADMDFRSPPPIVDALKKRVEHGVFGYPHEDELLKEAIADRMLERYGWKVNPEVVIFTPGVASGFNLACHAQAKPGGEVIMQTPVYFPFLVSPSNAGMRRVDNPLRGDISGRYEIDFEGFEAALNSNTALYMLCNPHNPVGRVFNRQELSRLAEICLKHDVAICSDEIHSDLIYSGFSHTPIASLATEVEEQTITLLAPSKTFNIPGLECAAAIIPNVDLRQRFQAARQGLTGGVNLMGLVAAYSAYTECQNWLDELLAYLEGNRDFMAKFIQAEMPELKMSPLEGTYLAWVDCRAAGLGDHPAEFFQKNARVGLNEGESFGQEGTGFVRINIGCPRQLLEEGLTRMAASLRKRPSIDRR